MVDPVQAARKAAIKREAKRNRERKQQAQDARALRRDTAPLERQIQRMEARQDTLSPEDQEELKRLKAEVAEVKRIKDDYIRKHPDQRNFVRGYEEKAPSSSKSASAPNKEAGPSSSQRSTGAQPQGATRDPRRSIYYDPVFNPYGAPPPGMPYLEKAHAQLVAEGLIDVAKQPPLPEETADFQHDDSDDSDSSVDDDLKDIIMPSGPPPIRLDPSSSNRVVGRGNSNGARGRGHGQNRGGSVRGRGSGPPHHRDRRYGQERARPNQHTAGSLPPRPPTGPSIRPLPPTLRASASVLQPPRPPGPPPSVPDGVVISAEPQLRDFKKESTAFVPAALRKKQQEEKARAKRGLPGRIDAAPISEGMSSTSSASARDKPDLLKSVQAHLPSKGEGRDKAGGSSNKEIGDLL